VIPASLSKVKAEMEISSSQIAALCSFIIYYCIFSNLCEFGHCVCFDFCPLDFLKI